MPIPLISILLLSTNLMVIIKNRMRFVTECTYNGKEIGIGPDKIGLTDACQLVPAKPGFAQPISASAQAT